MSTSHVFFPLLYRDGLSLKLTAAEYSKQEENGAHRIEERARQVEKDGPRKMIGSRSFSSATIENE